MIHSLKPRITRTFNHLTKELPGLYYDGLYEPLNWCIDPKVVILSGVWITSRYHTSHQMKNVIVSYLGRQGVILFPYYTILQSQYHIRLWKMHWCMCAKWIARTKNSIIAVDDNEIARILIEKFNVNRDVIVYPTSPKEGMYDAINRKLEEMGKTTIIWEF